jgi:small subunit ribosomal protein S2e
VRALPPLLQVDAFLKDLKDEVMKIMPVQKQSSAGQVRLQFRARAARRQPPARLRAPAARRHARGPAPRFLPPAQRTRFKAFVALGDSNGHLGLGVKCSAEVANAIRSAMTIAKLSIVPIRRGYWGGARVGAPHTVPNKLTGHCGSVRVRLIPAPRGTGLVAAPATKKMLGLAGIKDVYTSTRGHSRTMGNFIKATYFALAKSYSYKSPDLWADTANLKTPYAQHSDFLAKAK